MTNVERTIARFALIAMAVMLLIGIGAEITLAHGYSAGGGNNTQPTTQRPTER
jgi:hypothetical protein